MVLAMKAGIQKPWHRLSHRCIQAFLQTQGVDQKGSDYGRIKTLKIEHQDIAIDPWDAVHDKAPRAGGLQLLLADVGGNVTLPVQPGHIDGIERGRRTAGPIHRQAGEVTAFDKKMPQPGLRKKIEHQLGISQIILHKGV